MAARSGDGDPGFPPGGHHSHWDGEIVIHGYLTQGGAHRRVACVARVQPNPDGTIGASLTHQDAPADPVFLGDRQTRDLVDLLTRINPDP